MKKTEIVTWEGVQRMMPKEQASVAFTLLYDSAQQTFPTIPLRQIFGNPHVSPREGILRDYEVAAFTAVKKQEIGSQVAEIMTQARISPTDTEFIHVVGSFVMSGWKEKMEENARFLQQLARGEHQMRPLTKFPLRRSFVAENWNAPGYIQSTERTLALTTSQLEVQDPQRYAFLLSQLPSLMCTVTSEQRTEILSAIAQRDISKAIELASPFYDPTSDETESIPLKHKGLRKIDALLRENGELPGTINPRMVNFLKNVLALRIDEVNFHKELKGKVHNLTLKHAEESLRIFDDYFSHDMTLAQVGEWYGLHDNTVGERIHAIMDIFYLLSPQLKAEFEGVVPERIRTVEGARRDTLKTRTAPVEAPTKRFFTSQTRWEVGAEFARLRTEEGMNDKQIAALLGYDDTTVRRFRMAYEERLTAAETLPRLAGIRERIASHTYYHPDVLIDFFLRDVVRYDADKSVYLSGVSKRTYDVIPDAIRLLDEVLGEGEGINDNMVQRYGFSGHTGLHFRIDMMTRLLLDALPDYVAHDYRVNGLNLPGKNVNRKILPSTDVLSQREQLYQLFWRQRAKEQALRSMREADFLTMPTAREALFHLAEGGCALLQVELPRAILNASTISPIAELKPILIASAKDRSGFRKALSQDGATAQLHFPKLNKSGSSVEVELRALTGNIVQVNFYLENPKFTISPDLPLLKSSIHTSLIERAFEALLRQEYRDQQIKENTLTVRELIEVAATKSN